MSAGWVNTLCTVICAGKLYLTHLRSMFSSNGNHSFNLYSKSTNWFLCDGNIGC